MSREWQFEWISSWEQVWSESFLSYWQHLRGSERVSHVFTSPAILRVWQEYVCGNTEVSARVALGWHSSGTRSLFPLVRICSDWRHGGCRSLVPAGYGDLDYHDPILVGSHEPAVMTSFWPDFLHEASSRCAREVEEIIIRGIRHVPEQRDVGFAGQGETWQCDLTGNADVEGFVGRLSTDFRKELRRCERRLSEVGPVSLKVFSADETDAAMCALDPFWAAYHEQWNAWSGHKRFWQELVKRCLPEGLLWFSVLACGDRPISWRLGFTEAKCYCDWNASFDRSMAKYSPGALHILRLCGQCISRGIETYDFMRGSETYKQRWPATPASLYQVSIDIQSSASRLRRNCRSVLNKVRPCVRWLGRI